MVCCAVQKRRVAKLSAMRFLNRRFIGLQSACGGKGKQDKIPQTLPMNLWDSQQKCQQSDSSFLVVATNLGGRCDGAGCLIANGDFARLYPFGFWQSEREDPLIHLGVDFRCVDGGVEFEDPAVIGI